MNSCDTMAVANGSLSTRTPLQSKMTPRAPDARPVVPARSQTMWNESLTPTVRAQYGRISGRQDRCGKEVGKDLRRQRRSFFAHGQMNSGENIRASAEGWCSARATPQPWGLLPQPANGG